MADYKTKHLGSTSKHKNEPPILPKIGTGLGDAKKNAVNSKWCNYWSKISEIISNLKGNIKNKF